MKAKVIAVVGPVGVGKSTIIRAIIGLSKKRGFRAKSTGIKAFHGPSFILWKITSYIVPSKEDDKLAPWYVIGKVNLRIAQLLLLISTYLDSVTIPFMLMLKVILPKLCRISIFVEEYLLGTLLDYIYSFYNSKRREYFHLLPFKMLMSLCIKYKPDFTLFFDTDFSELKKHWSSRGYGDPQMEYVLFQKHVLPKLVQVLYSEEHFIKLRISGSITSTVKKVWSLIMKEF